MYPILFIARRLMFSLSVLYIGCSPGIQVVIFVGSSLVQVMYLVKCKPFEDKFKNRVEILNEATVLLVSSFIFIFCCND
jgi:hypothetical protein